MIELLIRNTGAFATVDAVDSDLLSTKWYVKKNGYCYRFTGRRRNQKEYLHRVVLARALSRPLAQAERADHRDRDKLNNRRNNVRVATSSQNATNSKDRSRRLSKYRGVGLHASGLWHARIRVHPNVLSLGYFKSQEAAAAAYDAAALLHHGQFATTNAALGLLCAAS